MKKVKTFGWVIKNKNNNKLVTKVCLIKKDLPSLGFCSIFTEHKEEEFKIIKVEIKEI